MVPGSGTPRCDETPRSASGSVPLDLVVQRRRERADSSVGPRLSFVMTIIPSPSRVAARTPHRHRGERGNPLGSACPTRCRLCARITFLWQARMFGHDPPPRPLITRRARRRQSPRCTYRPRAAADVLDRFGLAHTGSGGRPERRRRTPSGSVLRHQATYSVHPALQNCRVPSFAIFRLIEEPLLTWIQPRWQSWERRGRRDFPKVLLRHRCPRARPTPRDSGGLPPIHSAYDARLIDGSEYTGMERLIGGRTGTLRSRIAPSPLHRSSGLPSPSGVVGQVATLLVKEKFGGPSFTRAFARVRLNDSRRRLPTTTATRASFIGSPVMPPPEGEARKCVYACRS